MRMVYQCAECGEHFESKYLAIACHGLLESGDQEVTSCCSSELGEKIVTEHDSFITINYPVPCCVECYEALDE